MTDRHWAQEEVRISFGPDWTLWPHAVVRGAGFPADGVLELASDRLARLADDAHDESALALFDEAYGAESIRLGGVVHDIAAARDFQRALLLQNPQVYDTAVGGLAARAREDPRRDSRRRQWEDVVLSYWQRYCVKNESVGFFGPIGWATIGRGSTEVRPGESLVSSCDVFLENWAVDALASVLTAVPGVREWIAPRRLPYVRIELSELVLPQQAPAPFPAEFSEVLSCCDGRTPAIAIAQQLVACELFGSETAVYDCLEELLQRRTIAWRLETPVGPRPERDLRRLLEQVGSSESRERALALLDTLLEARDRVAESLEDPAALRTALAVLDETFRTLTKKQPVRHGGRTYGARTVVYQDCLREIDVELGQSFATAIEPVELVLESVRWLTSEFGEWARTMCAEDYVRLRGRTSDVRLSDLWFEAMPNLQLNGPSHADELVAELQARWSSILGCDPADGHVVRRPAEIRPGVIASFHSPDAGWNGARYCSPDFLPIAREGTLAVDDFHVVLGEVHVAINSIQYQCFHAQHPAPEHLWHAVENDFPLPRLVPVLPKESPPRLTARTHPLLARPQDYQAATFELSVAATLDRLRFAADIQVREEDDRLVLKPDDACSFDVLDAFSELLMGILVDRFRIFPSQLGHTPRLNFDRLVVTREAWRFPAGEVRFAFERTQARRFVDARRWATQHSLPRHVFVKPPGELKPMFVDFESPAYVGLLGKAVRRVAEQAPTDGIAFVEMLPNFEDLWLSDAHGRRYTAEIRTVAVDGRGSPGGV